MARTKKDSTTSWNKGYDPELEEFLKKLSSKDEIAHPATIYPLLLFYTMTPHEAIDLLTSYDSESQIKFDMCMNCTVERMVDWLSDNIEMVKSFFPYCDNAESEHLYIGHHCLGEHKVSAEAEVAFINAAPNNKNKIKRVKILAALDALHQHWNMRLALNEGDNADAVKYMFFFMRSLAQFSGYRPVIDGLTVQKGRRNKKTKDKAALIALKRYYREKAPNLSEEQLWIKVVAELKKKLFIHGDYTVRYVLEPTDSRNTAGHLVQTNEKGQEYPIQYEAFRKIKL